MTRAEELEGQLREAKQVARESTDEMREQRSRADREGLANFRLQQENHDVVALLSITTDERNTLRALRTSAERDLNVAQSRIAAHEAQIYELVIQHDS
eukprot:13310757-Alexandrium_andersonii.AAC.1